MSSDNGIEPGFVDDLLALETREQQTEFLRDAGLLDANGLDRLLDIADEMLGSDPGEARQLADLCTDTAEGADAPAAVPRANYILAGVHNINGDLDGDLRLTKAAYDGYVALGMYLEALRTNVGRMLALLELGRHQEALDTGQAVLNALDGRGELTLELTRAQADLLTALVYQNRGRCLEYMGRYEEALGAYAVAEERYRDLNIVQRLGEISANRGAILLHLGRSSEALAAQEAAADIFDKAGLTLSYAKALANIGEANLRIGNYARSLDTFERTHRLLQSVDALATQHTLLLNMADAYLALNLYFEALATYREADSFLQSEGMTHLRAEALWSMGLALIARMELGEAEEVLNEAASLFRRAENTPLLSSVMLEQASIAVARGDSRAALAIVRRALALVSGEKWPVQLVYAHLRLADLLLPSVDEAEPHLLEAKQQADRLVLPQLSYRLNERLGHLRLLQNRDEEARTLLESAVEEIERLRGSVTQDAMRVSFLRDKTAAYEDLLRLYLTQEDEGNIRRAFAVAEKAKSRALVDLLAGVVENGPGMSVDPVLANRLRAKQADLNAAYNDLLRNSGKDERRASVQELQARVGELEGGISRLRMQAAAAGSATELFAAPIPLDAIQEELPPDVTLLSYHVVSDEIMAFVNASGHTRAVRHVGRATEVQRLSQKLAIQWDRFRAGQGFTGRHMASLERSARQVLSALYAELLEPLEPFLGEAANFTNSQIGKLAIVPHGTLHQVPFHSLFDGDYYMIDRFEISYAPSATVYALCQGQSRRDSSGALVIGVEDPSIPAATTEARAVTERLSEAKMLVGEEAAVATLQSEVPRYGTLHLACHGLFRADNPMFSALKLHDGWLVAADVMQLDLTGALVTLSACESGRNEVYGGDEVIGLTRAFLGAGAATLVVSLWLVQDETTAELMADWYERMRAGTGPASALRTAQLELKERHPHPYYWAPFVLTGKR